LFEQLDKLPDLDSETVFAAAGEGGFEFVGAQAIAVHLLDLGQGMACAVLAHKVAILSLSGPPLKEVEDAIAAVGGVMQRSFAAIEGDVDDRFTRCGEAPGPCADQPALEGESDINRIFRALQHGNRPAR